MRVPLLMEPKQLLICLFICMGLWERLSAGCFRQDIVEHFHYTSESSAEEPVHQKPDVQLEFLIIGRKVTWREAKLLCPLYVEWSAESSSSDLEAALASPGKVKRLMKRRGKMHNTNNLAVIADEDQANWLARMLSESNYRYEGLWIGGSRKNKSSSWTWISDGKSKGGRVPRKILFETYPSWYHVTSEVSSRQNCLLFNRLGHDIAAFVPENCQFRRPFICMRDVKRKLADTISEGSSVSVDGYRYTLYNVDDENDAHFVNTGTERLNGGGVTWKNADLECKRRGKALAMVFSNDAATAIADMMLKSRPSMENVWLGGWSLDGVDWVWVPTGSSLSAVKSRSSQYPPWLEGHPVINSNGNYYYQRSSRCLILDRHLCPQEVAPVFLDLDCEKERPFVCQDHKISDCSMCDIDFDDTRDSEISRIVEGKSGILNDDYEFSEEKMTYEDAESYCNHRHGEIANILNSEILSTCLEKMSELAISHLWVGGRTVKAEGEWYWVDSSGNELSTKEIGTGETWCLGQLDSQLPKAEPNSCLNLDYESRGYPLFYGLPCNSSQIVLCSTPFNKSLDAVVEVRPDEVDTRIIGNINAPLNKYVQNALSTLKNMTLKASATATKVIKGRADNKQKHQTSSEPTTTPSDGTKSETVAGTTATDGVTAKVTAETASAPSSTIKPESTTVAATGGSEAPTTTVKPPEAETPESPTSPSK